MTRVHDSDCNAKMITAANHGNANVTVSLEEMGFEVATMLLALASVSSSEIHVGSIYGAQRILSSEVYSYAYSFIFIHKYTLSNKKFVCFDIFKPRERN